MVLLVYFLAKCSKNLLFSDLRQLVNVVRSYSISHIFKSQQLLNKTSQEEKEPDPRCKVNL